MARYHAPKTNYGIGLLRARIMEEFERQATLAWGPTNGQRARAAQDFMKIVIPGAKRDAKDSEEEHSLDELPMIDGMLNSRGRGGRGGRGNRGRGGDRGRGGWRGGHGGRGYRHKGDGISAQHTGNSTESRGDHKRQRQD